MSKYLFLLLLFTASAWAQVEFSDLNKRYSDKYYSGKYLIFDCQDKHYVCTDKDAVETCEKARKDALEKDGITLPCLVIKEFKGIPECNQKNKELSTRITATDRRCYHPNYLNRLIIESKKN